jgi:hypothetical protein
MTSGQEIKSEEKNPHTPYLMNNVSIVQMIKKNFRTKGIKKYTTDDMRKEYFNIVVKGKLESQEWIDYYKSVLEK